MPQYQRKPIPEPAPSESQNEGGPNASLPFSSSAGTRIRNEGKKPRRSKTKAKQAVKKKSEDCPKKKEGKHLVRVEGLEPPRT